MNNKILHKNYTKFERVYQPKLPLEIETIIPGDDSVRLLSQFVEEMDLSDLYSTYKRVNKANVRILLKIVLYAYMNKIYSSREIERACRRDINFMYLLEDHRPPDHATIARFRTVHFASCSRVMLAGSVNLLKAYGEISCENIFIDGTKIEAYANKYGFVWKKTIAKLQDKLEEKIAAFVAQCEDLYGIKVVWDGIVRPKHLKKLMKKLMALKKSEGIEFNYGPRASKNPLQCSVEILRGYMRKLKEYGRKLYICGNRNSYSKTDEDATFMHMKEDYMRNGQLKPGYNLQHGVDSEYVVWVTTGPERNDTMTLIPLLNEAESYLGFRYENVVADSGYESEENYSFLEGKGITAYIKPANYEISRTRKYRKDIGRSQNMTYLEDEDAYICADGRKLSKTDERLRRNRNGFRSEESIYRCSDCSGCLLKTRCIKGNNSSKPLEERDKSVYVSKNFERYRKEDLERITSDKGIKLRMNRSIQAEGSFAELKEDMRFRRFLTRGNVNVLAESILLAIAKNINKLHNKIQSGNTGRYLFEVQV